MFLTGLFLYLLLRVLKRSPVAALTGALIWMFCGLQIVWTEFQTPTAALCWLPAVLLCWEIYAQGRGWRWAVLAAAAPSRWPSSPATSNSHSTVNSRSLSLRFAAQGRTTRDEPVGRSSLVVRPWSFSPPPSSSA